MIISGLPTAFESICIASAVSPIFLCKTHYHRLFYDTQKKIICCQLDLVLYPRSMTHAVHLLTDTRDHLFASAVTSHSRRNSANLWLIRQTTKRSKCHYYFISRASDWICFSSSFSSELIIFITVLLDIHAAINLTSSYSVVTVSHQWPRPLQLTAKRITTIVCYFQVLQSWRRRHTIAGEVRNI